MKFKESMKTYCLKILKNRQASLTDRCDRDHKLKRELLDHAQNCINSIEKLLEDE